MVLSPTLTVYLARTFGLALLGALVVVGLVLVLFDVVELTRATGSQSVAVDTVVGMALYRLPMSLQTAFPFLFMGASLLVFWRLSRTGELVMLRAAGLSIWQVLAPVLAVVVVAGTLSVTVLNPLAAGLYGRFERLETAVKTGRDTPIELTKGGLWLRESRPQGLTVLHAEGVHQDRSQMFMQTVTLFRFDLEGRFDHRLDAEEAVLGPGGLTLREVAVARPGAPLERREAMAVPTSLSLPKIRDSFSAPETVSFWDLEAFIAFSEAAGFSALPHRLHRHALLASPLLLLSMVLVGALFAARANPRGANWLLRVGGAMVAGFVVFFFSKVTYTLGLSEALPPVLAAWAPALVTTFVALGLLLHFEDG